jgi:biopolymer transport protein TolR
MSRRMNRKPMSDINVVPYIDVMLVLLVIFMVTAPLLTQGVQVDLPNAPAKPISGVQDEPLIVSIKADGSYYLNLGRNPEKSVPLGELQTKIAAVLRRHPETPVLVWGDAQVPYGEVVILMSNLQAAGAPSVGLVTENPTPSDK